MTGKTDWRQDAARHAAACFPREACGLVVNVKGRLRYRPCENQAGTPEEHFVIGAAEFEAAEALGEIEAVFHSHPNAKPEPSAADRSACSASGLAWHILALPSGEWAQIEPHGIDLGRPLYGREFVHGGDDCYGFVRAWYASEGGVQLPEFAREDEWWRKGQNLYLENFQAAGFTQVRDGSLAAGDVLLMQIHADVPNHAAIYLGDEQIGHHLYGRLSSREVFGGYYRKHHTHTLRYTGHAA